MTIILKEIDKFVILFLRNAVKKIIVMKKICAVLLLSFFVLSINANANFNTVWQKLNGNQIPSKGERKIVPQKFATFYLNTSTLKNWMATLGNDAAEGQLIEMPQPNGSLRTFKVWQTPIMAADLAAKYPSIKTFTGVATDDKFTTAKFDFSEHGFHAMVFDGDNTYFIDPYSNIADGYYTCYYKKDYAKPEGKTMICAVGDLQNENSITADNTFPDGQMNILPKQATTIANRLNGTVKRTYRLALACTFEYAKAVDGITPTKAGVLSAMVTSINRVTGIYERELAVSLQLVANTDTLIFLTASQPYTNGSGGAMLNQNQTTVDDRIGTANYDIGHVFSTGGGGIAQFGVCDNGLKAQGVTGSGNPVGDAFDVDYVAHEMGHQFHANHTFNANTSACGNNGVSTSAYEPGSGTTIMAYAGICGSGDNPQPHSDDYFHAKSLDAIGAFITGSMGNSCATTTTLANTPPALPTFGQNYSIPYLTSFELIAPSSTDADHDSIKYCWEQWNRGNFKSSWSAANLQGPIYRTFAPTFSPTRVFLRLDSLLNNKVSYLGEKLPQDTRFLTFRLTVRDMLNGIGSFNFADDTVHIDVINTGTPFAVTYPNAAITFTVNTNETITWDIGGSDAAPINCSLVDILLSTDGGLTYPTVLKSNTPNDGSEIVTIPNMVTNDARIKIKSVGNVFFDICNFDFKIAPLNNVKELAWQSIIQVYPIPANDLLNIVIDQTKPIDLKIVNTLGQSVWNGTIKKQLSIPVANWAKGIYYLHISDNTSKEQLTKKVVIQ